MNKHETHQQIQNLSYITSIKILSFPPPIEFVCIRATVNWVACVFVLYVCLVNANREIVPQKKTFFHFHFFLYLP